MPFKTLRKVASSFLHPKKSITNLFSTSLDGSTGHVIQPRHSSLDIIRPEAIQPHYFVFDTIYPTIHVEGTEGTIMNATENQKRTEELHEAQEKEVQELRESQKRVAEMQHREQQFPPPKLDDEEYIIIRDTGYIQTSKRTLVLWDRGWVDRNTWLEDEMRKMDEDLEYMPMGCGL